MKSKEEILTEIAEQNNRDSWSLSNGMDFFDGNASSVFKAMEDYAEEKNQELKEIVIQLQKDFVLKLEEHAKQECIEYAKFCMENTCQDLNIPNVWVHNPTYKNYTDEELYNLFLQSKQ